MKSATIITLGAIAASSLPAAAQSFNIEFGVAGTAPDASYAGVGEAGGLEHIRFHAQLPAPPTRRTRRQPHRRGHHEHRFRYHRVQRHRHDERPRPSAPRRLLHIIQRSNRWLLLHAVPRARRISCHHVRPCPRRYLAPLKTPHRSEHPDPVLVGGSWSGTHEQGVTYMSQLATVGSDGRLDIHSGLPNGNIRSVCNGIQVIQLPPACAADLTGDGSLDFFDISAFLAAFSTMNAAADFTSDGNFDFFDVSAFLNAFTTGCP